MPTKRTIPAVCEQCGNDFLAFPNSRARFCSRRCAAIVINRSRVRPMPGRFWAKVDRSGECWLWQGATVTGGYGLFRLDGHNQLAHRVAYALTYGPIPDDVLAGHHCDTPACCRPDHLFLGTHLENARDRDSKGRLPLGNGRAGAKLTPGDVQEIRRRHAAGEATQGELAHAFGVDRSKISRIVARKSWNHVA